MFLGSPKISERLGTGCIQEGWHVGPKLSLNQQGLDTADALDLKLKSNSMVTSRNRRPQDILAVLKTLGPWLCPGAKDEMKPIVIETGYPNNPVG